MIRILLVDDQVLLCEVLQTRLEKEKDFQIVGRAHDGQTAIAQVEALQPDIVLIDIEMPVMDGLSATKIICHRFPHVKVIVLSGLDDDAYLAQSLTAGAKNYLLKNANASDLADTIRAVYSDNEQTQQGQLSGRLEEMLENYKLFQQDLKEARTILDRIVESEAKFDSRLRELETTIQSRWKRVRDESLNFQDEAKTSLKDMEQAKEQFDTYLTELNTLKNDFEFTLNQLNQAGFNPMNFRKIHTLEEQVYEFTSTLKKIKKQVFLLYNCLFFSIVISVMAVVYSILQNQ
jgi:YesN/AraC family two-component response regulator